MAMGTMDSITLENRTMEIDMLLERFGNDTGLGRLALDAANACTFLVDEMKVSFLHVPEGGRLLVFAEVGELPEDGRSELLLAALRANYLFRGTSGATIAVRPDSPTLFLNRSLRLDDLSYEEFVQILGDFADTLSEWKRMLADYRPDISPAVPADAEEVSFKEIGI